MANPRCHASFVETKLLWEHHLSYPHGVLSPRGLWLTSWLNTIAMSLAHFSLHHHSAYYSSLIFLSNLEEENWDDDFEFGSSAGSPVPGRRSDVTPPNLSPRATARKSLTDGNRLHTPPNAKNRWSSGSFENWDDEDETINLKVCTVLPTLIIRFSYNPVVSWKWITAAACYPQSPSQSTK
jgi:hypothetical protein